MSGERRSRDIGRRIIFVTTPNTDPWSAAEELWAQAALVLLARGFAVAGSITEFSPLHPRMLELRAHGVELWPHPTWYSLRRHPWRRLVAGAGSAIEREFCRLIAARPPALVVFSDGNGLPPVELLEVCVQRRIPFVTVMHGNKDADWYADDLAQRYRTAAGAAERCFFISESNRLLSEKQIGGEHRNAEIIRSPANVPFDVSLAWPDPSPNGELHFACVGRLYPPAKGQDLLIEALAGEVWQHRPWKLRIYGRGKMGQSLEWLAAKLGLSDRITFAGFAAVKEIWAANHVLVMPSRFEGMPLVVVEAMLCARPVIATNVGLCAEVIEDGVTGFLADAPTAGSIAAALERFWQQRGEAEQIGRAAARRIREIIPADPVRVFADRLQEIAVSASQRQRGRAVRG